MVDLRDTVAESAVISTVICTPDYIYYDEGLSHKHFYDGFNQLLFWALRNLVKRNKSITPLTLKYQIEGLETGKSYLSQTRSDVLEELIEKAPLLAVSTKEDYKDMANIVKTLSERRQISQNIEIYKGLIGNDDFTNRDIIKKVTTELETIHNSYISTTDVYRYTNNVRNIWEEIVDRRNDDGTYGIPTKHKILNEYITYAPGRLILLTSRKKNGKSMFGLNELHHKISMGKRVVYFDTEMPAVDFTIRLMTKITKIPARRLEKGGTTAQEEKQIESALKWIENQPFDYINSFDWNEDNIYTKLKILDNKNKTDLFIYDYIKNNEKGHRTAYDNYSYLGQMTNFLKNDIAVGMNVPVLSFAQLNKNNDVADSDQIGWFLSSQIKWGLKTKEEILEDGEEFGDCKATVVLNRDGKNMYDDEHIDFVFDRETFDISETKMQTMQTDKIPREIR